MGIAIYNKNIRNRALEDIIELELINIQDYQEFEAKLKDMLFGKSYDFMIFEIPELDIYINLNKKKGLCLHMWNPNPPSLTDYMYKLRNEKDIDNIIKIISRFLNNYK